MSSQENLKTPHTNNYFNRVTIRIVLIELIFSVLLPLILLLAIFLFFILYTETLEKIGFGKREVALLIIGSASTMFFDMPLFFYGNYFLALNIGGALIPIVLAFYFIRVCGFPFSRYITGLALVSIVSYMVTMVSEQGVISYFPYYLFPSIIAVLLAFLFFARSPKTCAFSYSISTLGVIIGADLAHLPSLFEQPFMGSMGGAGVYDMVFLAGLISFTLSFLFVRKERSSWKEIKRKRLEREVYAAGNLAGVRGSYDHIVRTLTGKSPEEFEKTGMLARELCRAVADHYALPRKRVAAFLVDFAIIFPVLLALHMVFGFRIHEFISIFLLVHVAYFTLLEFYFGSTVGKAVCDIEVRHMDNEPAGFMTVFTRNIIRLLEFFALCYTVSIILILVKPKRQRLGDMLADSIVVEVK